MKLNDFSGRSFNDMSQYYIFPWTVCNFDSQNIDQTFLNEISNFRDLTLPIGKCNSDRFNQYKKRF